MDLSVDILQLVVEYLPECAQYALIGDTPVGRHSCNQFYKYIDFFDFHQAFRLPTLHTLNTIQKKPDYSKFNSSRFVNSYKALKAQYSFYRPGEVLFKSLSDLEEFCEEYGDEIHKFKAIDLYLSFDDIRSSFDSIPVLNNVRGLSVYRGFPITEHELVDKFGSIKTLILSNPVIDVSWFPGIENLSVGKLSDFSTMGLKSLDVGYDSEFRRDFLPSTLKHLRFGKIKHGELDFTGLYLTSLNIDVSSSVNYCVALFESSLPQTLRKLRIACIHDSDRTPDVVPGPSTVFPSLRLLRLTSVPAEVWNCMITPNIRKLYIACLKGRLKSIDARNIEDLELGSLTLDEDFQFPSSLDYLTLSGVRRYRATGTNQTNLVEDKSLTLPESLISFTLDSILNFDFPKNLLKVVFSSEDINSLQSFFDRLPSTILEVTAYGKYFQNFEDAPAMENTLDLGRFSKMARLELSSTYTYIEQIVFPPNLVDFDGYDNFFSSIPPLPHLEKFTLSTNGLVTQPLKVPAKLRWLSIDGQASLDGVLDLRSSSLEFVHIYEEVFIKKFILPKTMKALSIVERLSESFADSSLCDSSFRIVYYRGL